MPDIIRAKVLIVGAGVSGDGLAYGLATGSNLRGRDISVIEQYSGPGEVNSHPLFNGQTVHDGVREINYSKQPALMMQAAAAPLLRYMHARPNPELWKSCNHMALAVGAEEVAKLEARYKEFKPHYPTIELIYGNEIGRLEPKVMEGRDPQQEVCAISGPGHICNYQVLSRELLKEAQLRKPGISVRYNTKVTDVRRENGIFVVTTTKGTYHTNVLVFAAGAFSLDFMQRLGYVRHFGQFSVAGDFYSAGRLLNGKVYRMPKDGRPFAAPHGDADILDMLDTRFGPTTKVLPFLERYNYGTVDDYFRIIGRDVIGNLLAIIEILASDGNLGYLTKQWLYSLPVVGKALLLPELQEITPTLRYRDLKRRKGAGGIRPQIVDLKEKKLLFGNVIMEGDPGDNVIGLGTPSPGGSKCIHNGEIVAKWVIDRLDAGYTFDQAAFEYALDHPFDGKTASAA